MRTRRDRITLPAHSTDMAIDWAQQDPAAESGGSNGLELCSTADCACSRCQPRQLRVHDPPHSRSYAHNAELDNGNKAMHRDTARVLFHSPEYGARPRRRRRVYGARMKSGIANIWRVDREAVGSLGSAFGDAPPLQLRCARCVPNTRAHCASVLARSSRRFLLNLPRSDFFNKHR